MKTVVAITCTYNRALCLDRCAKFFLDQDYEGEHIHLIYNNSPSKISYPKEVLNTLPSNKKVILINNYKKLSTGQPYSNVGDIFNDAFTFVPSNVDVITHMDDDDIFLPNHISEGVKGIERALLQGKKAYKPYYSYFGYGGKIQKSHNTLEPSIFIYYSFMKEHPYRETVVDYNQGWEEPLRNENLILIDEKGVSTFLYDWLGNMNTFKISGAANTHENFVNHKVNSNIYHPIIQPITSEEASSLYKLVENVY